MSNEINVAPAPEMSTSQTGVEEWRNITVHDIMPGRYQVSNFGRIRVTTTGLIRTPRLNHNGYLYMNLVKSDHVKRCCFVHRMVAYAFLPPPTQEQTQVDHINGVKTDNRPENLRWSTPQENANNPNTIESHRAAHKASEKALSRRVICENDGKPYDSITEAANVYGLSISTVSQSCYMYERRKAGLVAPSRPKKGTESLYFHFLDQVAELPLEERLKLAMRGCDRKNARALLCLDDNLPYPSYAAAAEAYQLTTQAVHGVCVSMETSEMRGKQQSRHGCHTFIHITPEEYMRRVEELKEEYPQSAT